MGNDTLITVDGVSKKFCRSLKQSLIYGLADIVHELRAAEPRLPRLRDGEFWSVDDVSFELQRGQCLALIGRNGAGKTTLLKLLNGLFKPDRGRIQMRGRVSAIIALGAGFNPLLTGRENVYASGAVLGLRKKEIDGKLEEIVEFAELREFIDTPVMNYSSGMQVRLGFSVATALKPDILLLDEVLAVGDAAFQAKCYQRLGDILPTSAVIFVSHSHYHVKKICDAALYLELGRLQLRGKPDTVLAEYNRRENTRAARLCIVHDAVKQVTVECQPTVEYGTTLTVTARLTLSDPVNCDMAFINIVDATDTVHAQIQLGQHLGPLHKGLNTCNVVIGPLHIAQGQYALHLLLLTNNGKTTVAHIRHGAHFSCTGPLALGPTYYPPACVTLA